MRELEYPYKSNELIAQKKRLKRAILENSEGLISIKIAILAGSTVNELKDLIELFLFINRAFSKQ